jgi:hypothetical protein
LPHHFRAGFTGIFFCRFFAGRRLSETKRLLALTVAAALLLSGCSILSGDASSLMSPPKLTSEQLAIEKALDGCVGHDKYTLKYSREGDYRSAFILHNLDADQELEAVALYCPNGESAGTHLMILKKTSGKWRKACDFSSSGSDVDKIEFGDYVGAGHDDIAVAWTELTSTNLGLSVYDISGKKQSVAGTFAAMKTVDTSGSGKSEILLLSLDKQSHEASASLYAGRAGALVKTGSAELDPTVGSYAGIYQTKADGKTVVFVDAYKGQHGMVTEVIDFSDGALKCPSIDPMTGTVRAQFTRATPTSCRDINMDGVYEIPQSEELPGYGDRASYADKLWLYKWYTYSQDKLGAQVCTCVINSSEGYYFIFPQKWAAGGVTVDNAAGDNAWTFRLWDGGKMKNILFTISVCSADDWNSRTQTARSSIEVLENQGDVYTAILGNRITDGRYLDISDIRQNLRMIS